MYRVIYVDIAVESGECGGECGGEWDEDVKRGRVQSQPVIYRYICIHPHMER